MTNCPLHGLFPGVRRTSNSNRLLLLITLANWLINFEVPVCTPHIMQSLSDVATVPAKIITKVVPAFKMQLELEISRELLYKNTQDVTFKTSWWKFWKHGKPLKI